MCSKIANDSLLFCVISIKCSIVFRDCHSLVFDTLRTKQKQGKLLNQMLSTLSFFDVLGLIAYAFTMLPTSNSDYLYGSKGNKKTCLDENSHLALQFHWHSILKRSCYPFILFIYPAFSKHKGFYSNWHICMLSCQYPCNIC